MGLAAGINPYTFADGNPVSLSDPSGRNVGCTYAWGIETCYELPDLELRAMLHLLLRIDGSGPAQPEYDGVGGGGGPAAPAGTERPSCGAEWADFGISAVLDLTGFALLKKVGTLTKEAAKFATKAKSLGRAGRWIGEGQSYWNVLINNTRPGLATARRQRWAVQGAASGLGVAALGADGDRIDVALDLVSLVPIPGFSTGAAAAKLARCLMR